MTRKDYHLIATAIRRARVDIHEKEPPEAIRDMLDGVSYATEWLCAELGAHNPRFDELMFRHACEKVITANAIGTGE